MPLLVYVHVTSGPSRLGGEREAREWGTVVLDLAVPGFANHTCGNNGNCWQAIRK